MPGFRPKPKPMARPGRTNPRRSAPPDSRPTPRTDCTGSTPRWPHHVRIARATRPPRLEPSTLPVVGALLGHALAGTETAGGDAALFVGVEGWAVLGRFAASGLLEEFGGLLAGDLA